MQAGLSKEGASGELLALQRAMSVKVKGEVWDLGAGLQLQCGTPYALMEEDSARILYALIEDGTTLETLVGERVEVVGEVRDVYPAAEVEVLQISRIDEHH